MQTIGCAKIDRSDRLGEHISRNNARTTDITKYDCGFAIIQQISYHWSGVEPSTMIGGCMLMTESLFSIALYIITEA
jgi:hypothetical protein